MKIAIMQPYLFPYIGYFSLIRNTDYFVFFDTPQYIRKGWIISNPAFGFFRKGYLSHSPMYIPNARAAFT